MDYSIAYQSERRSIRHAAELKCHVVADKGFRWLGGTTLDVSSTGVRLSTDATVELGETVVLTVRLPRGRTWVDAHGRITRIERGTRDGDAGRAVAIEFTAIDRLDQALLAGATAKIPPPIPRRLIRKDYAATVIAAAC